MKQKIIQFGHSTLRQNSAEVPEAYIASTEIQDVIQTLKTTLPDNGIGLAAPQINQPWRIFLADISNTDWSQSAGRLSICINPEVSQASQNLVSDWEGCLSAPGLWGKVARPESVVVSFTDEFGNRYNDIELHGVAARVFQHELDHLDGILFVDRMEDMKTLMTDEEFDKIRDNSEGISE